MIQLSLKFLFTIVVLLQEMVFGTRNKTIRWQFIKTLEPHRVSHVRTLELLSRENVFAQITVRFHTQQVSSGLEMTYKTYSKTHIFH